VKPAPRKILPAILAGIMWEPALLASLVAVMSAIILAKLARKEAKRHDGY
jgi:hypothetical protein